MLINETQNHSTGPRSPEGKAISALNATKHGCCSRTIRLTNDESIAEYQALEQLWFKGYNVNPHDPNPEKQFEAALIRDCVQADWLARRADQKCANLEADLFNSEGASEFRAWTQNEFTRLTLANRYRTANRNALTKARKALEDYRKARAAEKLVAQKLKHNEEKQTILIERHAPEPSFEEAIAEARQISIRLGYLNPDGTPTGKK